MAKTIKEIMEQYNCGMAKAKYIRGKQLHNLPYKPHADHYEGYKYEDYKDEFIVEHTWRKRSKTYNGLYTTIKGRSISLASLIWLQANKQDIPAGYLINHIDNDPNNNDINNLELIKANENTTSAKKGGIGRNQYTKGVISELILEKRDYLKRLKEVKDYMKDINKVEWHYLCQQEKEKKKQFKYKK